MFSAKRRFIRLVRVLVLCGLVIGLAPSGNGAQERGCDCDSRKHYYLSTDSVTGAEVGQVCRTGFHMASAWEILDTSNLKYAKEFGLGILGGRP